MNIFPATPASTRQAFTLVELLIAVTVLIVAMLGAVGTISTISSLGESNRESTVAYQAARAVMETLSSETFEELFARYNSDPADDPIFAGSGPGPNFAVDGLDAQAGDADGLPGRVLLPESAGALLLETLVDSSFGMPRDLDGSGGVDAADHADDYILLPVRVRIEWTGKSGDRFVEYATILGRRR